MGHLIVIIDGGCMAIAIVCLSLVVVVDDGRRTFMIKNLLLVGLVD